MVSDVGCKCGDPGSNLERLLQYSTTKITVIISSVYDTFAHRESIILIWYYLDCESDQKSKLKNH